MTSHALDLTTIGHALLTLLDENIGGKGWEAQNLEQREFLAWYENHRDEIAQLDNLKSLASEDYQALNKFLTDEGFDPTFDKFDGIGVVSILDMLVQWLEAGTETEVVGQNDGQTYPAFELSGQTVRAYEIPHFNRWPLFELTTKTGYSVWLSVTADPMSELKVAGLAQWLASAPRIPSKQWTGSIIIPMVDLDLQPDISWLCGMSTQPDWLIGDAKQQFKFRMNHIGARVKVATSMLVTRGISYEPGPFVFDQPFLGFFTQPGHEKLPLAAFYADTDSWRQPDGSLEEL